MNIYVGNLSYGVADEDLKQLFGEHGPVKSASVIQDRDSGRSKGFGFVEMESDADGGKAIAALNEVDFQGRNLRVNEARPREDKPQRSGGGDRRW